MTGHLEIDEATRSGRHETHDTTSRQHETQDSGPGATRDIKAGGSRRLHESPGPSEGDIDRSKSMVQNNPFWSERAQTEFHLQQMRPAFLDDAASQLSRDGMPSIHGLAWARLAEASLGEEHRQPSGDLGVPRLPAAEHHATPRSDTVTVGRLNDNATQNQIVEMLGVLMKRMDRLESRSQSSESMRTATDPAGLGPLGLDRGYGSIGHSGLSAPESRATITASGMPAEFSAGFGFPSGLSAGAAKNTIRTGPVVPSFPSAPAFPSEVVDPAQSWRGANASAPAFPSEVVDPVQSSRGANASMNEPSRSAGQ